MVEIAEAPRERRRRLAKSHRKIIDEEFHQEFFVWVSPWDNDPMAFDTAGKARRFRRKHQKEIEHNFDF